MRPLAVAGAFHTHYMAPAADALAAYAAGVGRCSDPRPILLSNADGAAVTTGADLRRPARRQVTLPVRWDLCLRSCADLGVTAVIELAPAGTLTGIAKRELPGVELLAIKTPDDLEPRPRRWSPAGPQHGQGEHTPDFRVVVTPAKGVFTRADDARRGRRGRPRHPARHRRAPTATSTRSSRPRAGVLAEWLRHDGDIVAAGLPVARIPTDRSY